MQERWVRVEEKLPREMQSVLVYAVSKQGFRELGVGYMLDGEWVTGNKGTVTHWAKIPRLPED